VHMPTAEKEIARSSERGSKKLEYNCDMGVGSSFFGSFLRNSWDDWRSPWEMASIVVQIFRGLHRPIVCAEGRLQPSARNTACQLLRMAEQLDRS